MARTPARRKQRKTRGKPSAVDVHVGSRLRQRRTLLGLSQEKLSAALDLTFQQVQKYERGTNRIGAGRLYELSKALDVPVSYFFDELPETAAGGSARSSHAAAVPSRYEGDPMTQRETLLLVRAYYGIADAAVRRRIFDLIRAIAGSAEAQSEC